MFLYFTVFSDTMISVTLFELFCGAVRVTAWLCKAWFRSTATQTLRQKYCTKFTRGCL